MEGNRRFLPPATVRKDHALAFSSFATDSGNTLDDIKKVTLLDLSDETSTDRSRSYFVPAAFSTIATQAQVAIYAHDYHGKRSC